MTFAPGQMVMEGSYRIHAVLHDEPQVVVIAATHVVRGFDVAIKIMNTLTNALDVRRFMLEARLLARVQDERVIRISDIGVLEDQRPYLVMELVDGPSLATMLANGPLDLASAVRIAQEICEGLGHIHASGIVHRNLEPSNVLLPRAGQPLVKIIDFFLAREIGKPLVGPPATMVIGMPPYAAPEQLDDPVSADGRSDLWSLGVVLCQMLSGQLPFSAPSFAELVAAIHDGAAPSIPASIPPALRAVIERCLAHDPAARYQTAGELAAELARVG